MCVQLRCSEPEHISVSVQAHPSEFEHSLKLAQQRV